jgi:heat-inducible transcriptional repressor
MTTMDERKKIILHTIIIEHIKSGAPVGSSALVEKYKLDVSPATVRNEMAELEEEGYIIQPHTSAGRIPTEKAYIFYLENLKLKNLTEIETAIFNELLKDINIINLKKTAKELSKFSGLAVFWAIDRYDFYYTGITNLLQQPEFSQSASVLHITAVIDQIDEIVEKIFDKITPGVHTYVGSNNPFGDFCSSIISKYEHDEKKGMFGLVGPLRMNYEKSLSLVNFINEKLINQR